MKNKFKMKSLFNQTLAILFSLLVVCSCGKDSKFMVEGKIDNANGEVIYLERRGHADVTILDSLTLNNEGDFKFKQTRLGYPEFYKIRIKNKNVNFVIDSTETITIRGDYNTLNTAYEIEGSEGVKTMKAAGDNLNALYKKIDLIKEQYQAGSLNNQQFNDSVNTAFATYKEQVKALIINDFRNSAGYYALFLRYNDEQILNPYDKEDLSLFRTVATVWDANYTNSPRNKFLKNYTLAAVVNHRKLQQQEKNIEELSKMDPVSSADFFSVELPDISGKAVSSKASRGKVLLLDFTAYEGSNSAPRNIMLNKIYEKYKNDIDIYQVSFDIDEHKWKTVADNLPWITVWDARSLESPLIGRFNISSLPATYLMNRKGEIIKKLEPNDDLEKLISNAVK